MTGTTANRNQDCFFDFKSNPSLGDALADKNPGDKFTVEMEVMVVSKDDKGMSVTIEPNSVVPSGYEKEEDPDKIGEMTPTVQPPGALSVAPVQQAMYLRKKGK